MKYVNCLINDERRGQQMILDSAVDRFFLLSNNVTDDVQALYTYANDS